MNCECRREEERRIARDRRLERGVTALLVLLSCLAWWLLA